MRAKTSNSSSLRYPDRLNRNDAPPILGPRRSRFHRGSSKSVPVGHCQHNRTHILLLVTAPMLRAESDPATGAPRVDLSEFPESTGDSRLPGPTYLEGDSTPVRHESEPLARDLFGHEPACDSPETQERDEMGPNGTEIKKATPSGPASRESQVQNAVSAPQKWEELGNNGNERENFSPISPACSVPQASDSEPSADEDNSETTGTLFLLGSACWEVPAGTGMSGVCSSSRIPTWPCLVAQ